VDAYLLALGLDPESVQALRHGKSEIDPQLVAQPETIIETPIEIGESGAY
jgi:hypothetical protein